MSAALPAASALIPVFHRNKFHFDTQLCAVLEQDEERRRGKRRRRKLQEGRREAPPPQRSAVTSGLVMGSHPYIGAVVALEARPFPSRAAITATALEETPP